ncbi:PIG-L deacetylase family protein [Jatrophihabitans sp. DSM 45814]
MTESLINHASSRIRHYDQIGVLLGVWAHPDDEAYLSAGLMAQVREAGHRVVVATATKGELGTQDPESFPPERLAAIREREIAASLASLAVSEHHWLSHHDGALADVPAARGVRQVRRLIEQVQPDTIVTFGPDGLTGHSDHKAISRWVTSAWAQTGRRARLWYATLTPEFHQEWSEVNDAVGFWMDGACPPSDRASDAAFAVHCDQPTLDRKYAALQAHASQTASLIDYLGPDQYRRWWATETFIDARQRVTAAAAA